MGVIDEERAADVYTQLKMCQSAFLDLPEPRRKQIQQLMAKIYGLSAPFTICVMFPTGKVEYEPVEDSEDNALVRFSSKILRARLGRLASATMTTSKPSKVVVLQDRPQDIMITGVWLFGSWQDGACRDMTREDLLDSLSDKNFDAKPLDCVAFSSLQPRKPAARKLDEWL